MKLNTYILIGLITMMAFASCQALADDPDRRARWQASFKAAEPIGREITSIEDDSALQQAGLKTGDILIAVNNDVIRDANHWSDLTYSLRAATDYTLTVKRNNRQLDVTTRLPGAPLEQYQGLNVEYGFITSDYGIRQRTIVTLPENASDKLAAIYVVGGLSCSSIEYLPGRKSNFIRALQDVIRQTNMMVFRIEKPGVGDSDGRCSETDFNTELNGYEVALQRLLQDPRIDRNKVIVLGSSMGSALAPYLANKYRLNGVISDGSFYRSWFEHMLEIERRIQTMNGHSQAEVNQRINQAYIPLYYGMLIEKKSYRQVINEHPLLASYNYHDDAHMYGRPVAFYHQMQDFNFAGEWSSLTAPGRIRWGT